MLLGTDDQPPKIASYAGRGPLSAWVRVSAARMAVDLHRNEQEAAVDPAWAVRGVALDPEMLYVKERYGEEFGKALEAAFLRLTTRIRTILQLYFLEGVGAGQIAQSYGTSTRTVQRWIVTAQNGIVDEVKAAMTKRYQLSNSQLDSLFGAVETEMVAALRRVFAPKRKPVQAAQWLFSPVVVPYFLDRHTPRPSSSTVTLLNPLATSACARLLDSA